MPPCDAPYLLAYLFEVGPVSHTGMGAAPISFFEMRAWQDCVGFELSAFEVRALRRLSVAYVNESHAATKRTCPAPWRKEDVVKPGPTAAQLALRAISAT